MQFHGKGRPATPVIAKTLDVDALVEGSVTRSGDKVRITVQLIDARADRHMWAQSFERSSSDVLALQAELASAIAREINVQLTPSERPRLAAAPSVNPAAHDAYLKGRYFFNRPSDENLQKAIAQFEEAVRLNPDFALAWSGLSDAYLWAGYNEGFTTATAARPRRRRRRARRELDDGSAEAHASLATYKNFYEYDWEGSEREYRRAIALNPSYAFAHDQFGMGLAFQGRLEEAIEEGRRAAELDPLSPQVPMDATLAFAWKRDFVAARELARRARTSTPPSSSRSMEGWIELEAGRSRGAPRGSGRRPWTRRRSSRPSSPSPAAPRATGRAPRRFESLEQTSPRGVPPFNLALVHLGIGERERA